MEKTGPAAATVVRAPLVKTMLYSPPAGAILYCGTLSAMECLHHQNRIVRRYIGDISEAFFRIFGDLGDETEEEGFRFGIGDFPRNLLCCQRGFAGDDSANRKSLA
jgi:hypothetical protein